MIDNSKKKELFLQTLTKAYNHQEYVRFLQELLNDVQIVAQHGSIRNSAVYPE